MIDGAPQTADLAISAIKASDLVLIPVQPSPYDIWATADLVNLIKQRIKLIDGNLKAAFLINRTIKGTKIGGEIRAALEEYELPVLSTVIVQRIIYPTSAITGNTVLDKEPNGEAAKEIQSLANEIINLINIDNHI
ncbi:TPA: chromosome partitioning protein ParA [Neisseria meningitidis]